MDDPTIIQRQRLLNRMPKVGERRVGLLSAPAGYGKSVVLAHWAAAQTSPVAWVNVDQVDNDPTRFASAIYDAIAAAGVDSVVEVSPADDNAGNLDILDGLLADRDLVVGLVIDDLHQIVHPEVLEQVERWVKSPPSQFTLMIASREPAPFPSARMATEGRVDRISPRHLRFRAYETNAVLKRVQQEGQAPEHSLDIHHHTEGWPIAVSYLARIDRPQDVGETTMTLSKYVLEEVLSELPPRIVSFLLTTAHLDQLSPDLCDSVTAHRDSAEILAWLSEYQLFLVGDPPARYHHLFSELLRHRAERDPTIDVPALQKRAARWYHRQSRPEDALKHALLGNDTKTILATAGDVLIRSGLRSEYETCRTWLHALDPDILRRDRRSHDIAMLTAIHLIDEFDRAPWIESRLRFFGETDDVVLDYVRAVECWYQGRASEALQRAERVIEMAPEYAKDHASDLIPAFLDLGQAARLLALLLQGTLDHDDPLFTSLHGLLGPGGPLAKTRLSGIWAFVAYIDGVSDLAANLIEGFERSRTADKQGRGPSSVLGTITKALIASDNNADPHTQRSLAEGLEKELQIWLRVGRYVDVALTRLSLVRTYHRAGDRVAAKHHEDLANTLIRTFEDAPYLKAVRDRLVNRAAPDRSPTAPQDHALEPIDPDVLTEREQVVLQHLDSDLNMAEIARSLFVSRNTIKAHTKSIYRKLKVNSRHQAVRRLRNDQRTI
ncbi:MAG: hypothetical protein GEU79_06480 [Acidimicrobiia bacterium]|nr:hypothetical protein [Acidimicrobiia bacterium]